MVCSMHKQGQIFWEKCCSSKIFFSGLPFLLETVAVAAAGITDVQIICANLCWVIKLQTLSPSTVQHKINVKWIADGGYWIPSDSFPTTFHTFQQNQYLQFSLYFFLIVMISSFFQKIPSIEIWWQQVFARWCLCSK